MDSTNSSSFMLNESDLKLSMSLGQWDGFELENETEDARSPRDLVEDGMDLANEDTGRDASSKSPLSPGVDGESANEMLDIVRDFLLEKISQFYNEITNAQGENTAATSEAMSVGNLRKRYDTLCSQIANILGRFRVPGIEEEVNSRLRSVDAALRQLSVMKSPAAASLSASDSGRGSTDELGGAASVGPLHHWRHWVEAVEEKMCRIGKQVDWNDREELEECLKVQQALQNQIKHEGGYWLALVQRYFDAWPPSHRRQVLSSSIERRWHGLWIKSLEWQCRLERQIRALILGIVDAVGDDAELFEPVTKRRRLNFDYDLSTDCGHEQVSEFTTTLDDLGSDEICSAASDTIPFSENEYEPLTPHSAGDEDEPISARDGGYSSGSSAVVVRLDTEKNGNGSGEQSTKQCHSPNVDRCTSEGPATPEDPSGGSHATWESFKLKTKQSVNYRQSGTSVSSAYPSAQPVIVPPTELTDSLLVNVGDTASECAQDENSDENLFWEGEERFMFSAELEEILRRRGTNDRTDGRYEEDEEAECRETTPVPPTVDTPPNTPCLIPRNATGSLKRRYPEGREQLDWIPLTVSGEKSDQQNTVSPATPEDPAGNDFGPNSTFLEPAELTFEEASASDESIDYLAEILELLYQGRTDKDKLKIELEEFLSARLLPEPMAEEARAEFDTTSSPAGLKRRRLQANRKKQHGIVSNTESGLDSNSIDTNMDEISSVANATSPGQPRLVSFRRLIRRSWPVQVCLCVLVCLNLFYFYPQCCERMNRYWWSLGPKQYYSDGPPPT